MAQEPRWVVTNIENPLGLDVWFHDGKPVKGTVRGGSGLSYRLIVQSLGFLDITTLHFVDNGLKRMYSIFEFNDLHSIWTVSTDRIFQLSISINENKSFSVSVTVSLDSDNSTSSETRIASGFFKAFPEVSDADAAYIDSMIAQKYVPYQNIPDEPGKTDQEIRELGLRLFPWCPYSYQLAMAVYDWTTASFTRLVLMKVFQYTSIPETPLPLDIASIANMIWESNWGDYKPSNANYMNSFLMKPADTQANVEEQLQKVHSELHRFSDVENRLVAAAVQSLPRTCILTKPYLFSGQVDIYQMGMSRFGIEMLEFPGNKGPVGTALEVEFATAVAGFLKPGSVINTKMVWAFTDTEEDAKHYSNGILLVAEPPLDSGSLVWDVPAYITELSDGPTKTEYLFPPESSFRVISVETQESIQVIRLQYLRTPIAEVPPPSGSLPLSTSAKQEALRAAIVAAEHAELASDAAGVGAAIGQSVRLMIPALDQLPRGEPQTINHVEARKTNGRRCRCVEEHEGHK